MLKTSISFMLTQSFTVLPVKVIRTYLPFVSGTLYFSVAVVVPLLLPEKIFVKLLPSLETKTSNEFTLSFPLNQAISKLQTVFSLPRSNLIHEPRPSLDHLVSKLLSTAADAGFPD